MKTNIIKTEVDERKLQKEIGKYEIIHNQEAYLMMNKETMDTLTELHINDSPPSYVLDVLKNGSKLAMFQGNKCYVDNDLAFGEVEIR